MAMEGKSAGQGLQTMDEGDDMLSATARELAENNRIVKTAVNVWRALTREHQNPFPASPNAQLPTKVVNPPATLTLAPPKQLA